MGQRVRGPKREPTLVASIIAAASASAALSSPSRSTRTHTHTHTHTHTQWSRSENRPNVREHERGERRARRGEAAQLQGQEASP